MHVRDRIRAGALSVDEALEPEATHRDDPAARAAAVTIHGPGAPQGTNLASASMDRPTGDPPGTEQARPKVTVARDAHGDFTDDTGRIVIFQVHGDPPYMLMVDGRCRARTQTVTDAREAAWNQLHERAADRSGTSQVAARAFPLAR